MLALAPIFTHHDRERALREFDPLRDTWVVSDLKSKHDLSQALLAERGFIPAEAVLRASELWQAILGQARPDMQVVSREFALALIGEELAARDEAWARSPGAAASAFEYMTQLMPLLAHPEGGDIATDWLERHPEARARWGRWHEIARALWSSFLANGFLAPPWVAGVLVNEQNLTSFWARGLAIDLGAELTQVEADLIVALSQGIDALLLKPAPAWATEYGRALQPYEIFERRAISPRAAAATGAGRPIAGPDAAPSQRVSSDLPAGASLGGAPSRREPQYKKLATMIAEVKDAVAQAREWLDAGARPGDIAIVAPEIEAYWPALSAYLAVEGIAAQKGRVARLHSFPGIARWLASLRLLSEASPAEADLELCLFNGDSGAAAMGFDRFKALFSSIYGREDLARSPAVERLFGGAQGPAGGDGGQVGRDAFLAWALAQARDDMGPELIEKIVARVLAEAPEPTRLELRRWVDYLSQAAARTEVEIEPGDAQGISVVSLPSAEGSPCGKMIVLGLTEAALRSGAETSVLFADAQSLAAEFGFYLPHADRAKLEFEARWLLQGSRREILATFPETDFSAGIQAPAWIWVMGAQAAGSLASKSLAPRPSRWDELQRAPVAEIALERGWEPARARLLENAILQDLGLQPLPAFGADLPISLSASSIEDFLACPFVFAAKKVFRLADDPSLELDVGASTRGRLTHAVLERLAIEPFQGERSDDELEALVDEARAASQAELADERLWPSLKARHVDLARRFLAREREWRSRFPETATVGREVAIAGFVDIETGALGQCARGPGSLPFRGFIDRVDFDRHGFAAVIDYKSSNYGITAFSSWLEKDRLQLLLYAQALEAGLTAIAPRPVANAAYYVARTLSRDAGFKLSDVEQGLYDLADRKRNQLTSSEKQQMFIFLAAKLRLAAQGARSGEFSPIPKNRDDCANCRWSETCRAPHLSA
jgi:RecB family exonuclease